MFITFEGIDGCGKTCQMKLLVEYLQSQNKKVVALREPGGTEFSESIREILLRSKAKISSISELLLFNSARAHLVESIIKPAISKGEFVVCDRFFDSTTAYQGYGRKISLDKINYCNQIAVQGLIPDLTFYLDVPLELAQQRSDKEDLDRMELSGDEFYLDVITGYREMAVREPNRIILIDARGTIEHTQSLILERLSRFPNQRI